MNNYKKGMTIKLDDNNEYIILRVKVLNNIQYAYIQNVDNVDDDGFVILNGNKLDVVTDSNTLKYLFENM